MRFALFLFAALVVHPADAKPGPAVGPAANASEIPALARLLDGAGWLATPELSSGYHAGDIFRATESGHVREGADCFDGEVRESAYTQVELVSQLQAGVSMKLAPGASVSVDSSLVKKLKFGAPIHAALPGFSLVPTPACLDNLAAMAAGGKNLGSMYVVREVLTAEIAEQTCGRIDASGRFAVLGQADASLTAACSQASLEPVAVGYRIEPVLELAGVASRVAGVDAVRTVSSGLALPISQGASGWQNALSQPVEWREIELEASQLTLAGESLVAAQKAGRQRNTGIVMAGLGIVSATTFAALCAANTASMPSDGLTVEGDVGDCNQGWVAPVALGWSGLWGGYAGLQIHRQKTQRRRVVDMLNQGK